MSKHDGTEDHKHKGKSRTLEGNKEIGHRSWHRGIRIGGRGAQEGVAKKMTEAKKELIKIKETFVGAAQAAYDATTQLTSTKEKRSTDEKK